MCEASWLHFAVYSAYKSSSSQLQAFNSMTNLGKARLKLTESQLLTIQNRIKTWSTKDQVINLMRFRYGQLEDQAA